MSSLKTIVGPLYVLGACCPIAIAQINGTVAGGEYNLTLATQTTPTGFGDNLSELNRLLARLTPEGSLRLAFTGNVEPNGNTLAVFLDTRAGGGVASLTPGGFGVLGEFGGQKTDDWGADNDGGEGVSLPPGGPSVLSPGFDPETSLEVSADGGVYHINVIDMTVANHPAAPNRDVFLGTNVLDGTRADHPYVRDTGPAGSVAHAFLNTNTAGVNGYQEAEIGGGPLGDPGTATTGLETEFSPDFLNADPGDPIKLLAFVTNGGGFFLSNQFFPGLPAGTPNPGFPGNIGGNPLFDAENGFGTPLNNFFVTVPLPEWGNTGGGTWSTDSNWDVVRPDGANTTAKFGTAITDHAVINVESFPVLGALVFDNAVHSYTLADGGGQIFLAAFAGKTARIRVVSGDHTIAAPIVLLSDTGLSVSDGNTLNISGGLTAPLGGVRITKDGAGTVGVSRVRAGSLEIAAGVVRVTPGASPNLAGGTSVVQSLEIDESGATAAQLDLTNNAMVIDYDDIGPAPLEAVREHLRAGRLASSAADATHRLGYADNGSLLPAPRTSFAGQSVDESSILIAFTTAGDADFDGDTDGGDIARWATNFTGSLTPGTGTKFWNDGDWDYDSDVDGADAALWAQAFTGSLAPGLGPVVEVAAPLDPAARSILQGLGVIVVPEPGMTALAALSASGWALVRRRRRGA